MQRENEDWIKQYCLMMEDYNHVAKIWRSQTTKDVNKILDDFLNEFEPERAKPSSFEPKTKANK